MNGLFAPGKLVRRQSANFSSKLIKETQEGAVSKRLMNETSKARILRGSNIPLGELPRHTRWSTFPDQNDKMMNEVVTECCSDNEYNPDSEILSVQ